MGTKMEQIVQRYASRKQSGREGWGVVVGGRLLLAIMAVCQALAALLLRLEEIGATDDPVVVREEAETAIAQVERLAGVVDDLMGRAKRRPAETSAVSLDSVIAALQREWQPALSGARRSMRVHGERGLQVLIPRPALSQILSTLIENSLAHGRGTVSVHARRSGPTVVVEVSDDGPGGSGSGGGFGIGLANVRDRLAASYGEDASLVSGPSGDGGWRSVIRMPLNRHG